MSIKNFHKNSTKYNKVRANVAKLISKNMSKTPSKEIPQKSQKTPSIFVNAKLFLIKTYIYFIYFFKTTPKNIFLFSYFLKSP